MDIKEKIEEILLTDYGCFDDFTVNKILDLFVISQRTDFLLANYAMFDVSNEKRQNTTARRYNTLLHSVLLKYIMYVMEAEGTDFITMHDVRYMCDIKFTDEEWKILENISNKIKKQS
jgi:hypothetical protein